MAEAKKEPCWYVIHTYSGYENKVKDTLEKSVENNGMQDLIFEVRVPMEEVVEIRNGKRVKSTRKVYPGYVLVHMIETSESWYVVRNTRGVTGFVGPDSKPVPLTQSGTDRRCGCCLAGRNLQLDVSLYFLCHLSGTSINIVVERKRSASSHVAPCPRTGRCRGTAS